MGNYHARFYEGLGRGDTPSLLSSGNYSQFAYDGNNGNVKIVESGSGIINSTQQFVLNLNQKCESRDAGSTILKQYFRQGQTIASNGYFYTKNQIGSVLEMTDISGAVQAQYGYEPYGGALKIQGSSATDFGFADYYNHLPSELELTVHRAYNPIMGRWINRDPSSELGGINLYAYVQNEPINVTDPSGLDGFPIPFPMPFFPPTMPPYKKPRQCWWGPDQHRYDESKPYKDGRGYEHILYPPGTPGNLNPPDPNGFPGHAPEWGSPWSHYRGWNGHGIA